MDDSEDTLRNVRYTNSYVSTVILVGQVEDRCMVVLSSLRSVCLM